MNRDPMSIFIGDSVDYVRLDYYKRMFQTKKLFFQSLMDNKSAEYFKTEVEKIWNGIDHSFMRQRIDELEKMVAESNKQDHDVVNPEAVYKEVFKLDDESLYVRYESKYASDISSYYKGRLETIQKGFVDKTAYLSKYVDKYDGYQSNVPYFNKDGTVRSYHNVADYNSMVFNVNINKAGWNRTYYDSDLLGNDLVYLPAHPGSCPLCMPYQGKVYSLTGKNKKYPAQQEAIDGGVGHPNCKHQWTLYWDESQIQDNKFNNSAEANDYETRQKMRGVQLKRTKLKNDMEIYKGLGNYEEYDKAKSKVQLLNSKMKELKEAL